MTDIRRDRRVAAARPESHAASERREPRDFAVGNPTARNPLEGWSWPELRDEIYGTSWYASRSTEKEPAP